MSDPIGIQSISILALSLRNRQTQSACKPEPSASSFGHNTNINFYHCIALHYICDWQTQLESQAELKQFRAKQANFCLLTFAQFSFNQCQKTVPRGLFEKSFN
jgi:hypothetical protein